MINVGFATESTTNQSDRTRHAEHEGKGATPAHPRHRETRLAPSTTKGKRSSSIMSRWNRSHRFHRQLISALQKIRTATVLTMEDAAQGSRHVSSRVRRPVLCIVMLLIQRKAYLAGVRLRCVGSAARHSNRGAGDGCEDDLSAEGVREHHSLDGSRHRIFVFRYADHQGVGELITYCTVLAV